MKKRIISALMAIAMCVSALPMSVCAENNTVAPRPFVEKEYDFPDEDVVEYWKFLDRFNYDYWLNPDMFEYEDVELFEFTQRFCDEYLLDPEESEENRLIYNAGKRIYDRDLAIAKHYNRSHSDTFLGIQKDASGIYRVYCLSGYDDKQVIGMNENIASLDYIDNPCITKEEFNSLSYDDKIITAEKIYEETGEDIAGTGSISLACSPLYIHTDGKCYNWDDEEIDIVDGKIVTVYNNIPDNADVLTTETLKGDANEDGKVSVADAVLIMQALSNPDDYKLTEQGALNADYNGDGGVTTVDALEIQMIDIS